MKPSEWIESEIKKNNDECYQKISDVDGYTGPTGFVKTSRWNELEIKIDKIIQYLDEQWEKSNQPEA